MGRLDQVTNYYLTDDGYDNGLKAIIKDSSIKEDKVVIIDADSIIHAAVHPRREEERGEYTEDEIETIVIPKIREKLIEIQLAISEGFNIQKVYCFVGGKGSYRKEIFPLYKSNRTEKLEIIGKVYEICIKELNFIRARDMMEADDEMAILGNEYKELAILSYIDKDLKQIPGINYNYNKKCWYNVTEEEARQSLASQMCTGDDNDFIKVNKGLGEKTALKYVTLGMTNYQYIKGILKAYKDFNKDMIDVKPLIRQTYKLISLGTKYDK
jgi:5'-3' exonuclease